KEKRAKSHPPPEGGSKNFERGEKFFGVGNAALMNMRKRRLPLPEICLLGIVPVASSHSRKVRPSLKGRVDTLRITARSGAGGSPAGTRRRGCPGISNPRIRPS